MSTTDETLSEDDNFEKISETILEAKTSNPVIFIKDGRISKRNRVNYSRSSKAPKNLTPWERNNWL